MAVQSYGTTNILWSSFDTWSTAIASDSNVSLNSVMDALEPADSTPHQASELRSNAFLYGTVSCSTGGTVAVTSGYSQGATTSFTLKNVNFGSIASITLTATATYPYYFSDWRGDGTVISTTGAGGTTGTLTLTSGVHTGVSAFYATFATTHVSP